MGIIGHDILGGWKLVRFENRGADGHSWFPMGSNATGYIVYSPDGHVSVNLMTAGFLERPRGGVDFTADNSVQAVMSRGYMAYAGRFDIDEERRIAHHRIELSLAPEMVGVRQERHVRFVDGMLELSVPRSDEMNFSANLLWSRS